jgi:hypothetical protein
VGLIAEYSVNTLDGVLTVNIIGGANTAKLNVPVARVDMLSVTVTL